MFWKSYFIQEAKYYLIKLPKLVLAFFKFWIDFFQFKKKNTKRSSLSIADTYPCLKDKVTYTPVDEHYTYHPAWAARILAKTQPKEHIDISSILHFSTILSAFIPTKFYDYRPAKVSLSNFQSDFADLKKLPFSDDSIESLSCMHTIEHIGLGRYGDEIDTDGDLKAIEELKRVLQPNGTLLFVTPVGKPKVQFNAHRIYSYEQIIDYFAPLQIQEFSLIPDSGGIINNVNPNLVQEQTYGCGCFWFKKNI